ncbi:YcxB family protein [Chryseolinea lacunae]|uniref:YcxB-like protein domain-containing protein n=1 Tax=Chryseolinea lacunae TaxID=2801331 RepID=A0ABS1KV08_9BACT|nr:YcxB family protein [Chryseolinea lacunae]MBL0742537.1 hypothetical protein [Chryseolinea lacunae]
MTLTEHDYLTYQLYTASKSPSVRKGRLRRWLFTTITFAAMAFLFADRDDLFLFYYFVVATLLSLTLYPFYSRWRYKRHYEKYIREVYKNRFGEEATVEIGDEQLVTKDKTGEGKFNISGIEAVNEIADYYFIKMVTGPSLIVPKRNPDIDKFRSDLTSLVATHGIAHNVELDWRWK